MIVAKVWLWRSVARDAVFARRVRGGASDE